MKNKFKNITDIGFIYAFICKSTHLVYIGSTIQTIPIRLSKHLTDYRGHYGIDGAKHRCYNSSYEVFKQDNYDVIELEEYKFISDDTKTKVRELRFREQLYINYSKYLGIQLTNRGIASVEEIDPVYYESLDMTPLLGCLSCPCCGKSFV